MNEVQIFEHEMFGTVRTVKVNGKILFCGKDVASALGYNNPTKAVTAHCKGVSKVGIPTKGGKQNLNFISEGDIYRLVVSSKLPEAEKFESWVFDEVIPQIKETGGYIPMATAQTTPMSDEEIMARALMIAQKTIEIKNQELVTANNTIQELKPKADYTDLVLQSKSLLNVTQIAQDYGMSAVAFNRLLEELDIQYRDKRTGQWILKAKYKKLGWVGSTSTNITRSDGTPDVAVHTKWTQTGRLGLYEILKKNGHIPVMELQHEDYINGN